MELVRYLRRREWPTLFGYAFFIGMMTTGYYYNVTFMQLGLDDLGRRLIGMSGTALALTMAVLAILTGAWAIGFGWWMGRRGWSEQFLTKLRLAFGVVCVQLILTAVAPAIRDPALLVVWVVLAAAVLGAGIPATFSLTVDLIPTRDRGLVAALIAAGVYFAAAVFAAPWTIERFRTQLLGPMLVGAFVLGVLAFRRSHVIEVLAWQHAQPAFGRGRFVRMGPDGRPIIARSLTALIIVMFGVFFVDSLGFIRLIATPLYVNSAWQSADLAPRLLIGGTHVAAALIAGVLYTALGERHLLLWIFGTFALAHLMYLFDLRIRSAFPSPDQVLAMPLLYSLAVSLYTVLNFVIWADLSTPRTVSRNVAFGVAISGWTASFASTALSLWWRRANLPLDRHLSLVAALAILCFLALAAVTLLPDEDRPPVQESGS